MNEEQAITTGAVARRARARLGLTQAAVAERVGIAREVYGRLERGRVLPSVVTLRRLCQVLGLDANVLLGLSDGRGPHVPLDPPALRRLVRRLRRLGPEELRGLSLALGLLGAPRR
ncbi:helix-turn-helix domain-containing protein [Myxococcus sp. K15C18031901]|uniref:helix-turn-helix transcriptional regulator n=1 Tax=Myxococcus dinghuensis TaxID=2906761 RepID=UPI0020A7B8F7|nr:helix-turn-helix transcriptional regulator [Myxococcus dinghuensis]MCP3104125.1 helix-turn-helix domain-containing protein [Myxococcus dinghuensis]